MAPQIQPIVVDNASSDETVERARAAGARVVVNSRNMGFAAAANQGAKICAGASHILLLNPDAEIVTGLDALIDAANRYGIAAGQLQDEGGKPQKGFSIRRLPTARTLIWEQLGLNRLFPQNAVNRNYRCLDRDANEAGAVEQPAGAFLMVRIDVWKTLQGLDEIFYPVWFEDVDFCRRAQLAGFRIEYVPQAAARHVGGHSFMSLGSSRRSEYWCDNLLKYSRRHFCPLEFKGVCVAVMLSTVPRMVAALFHERNVRPVLTCCKIFATAARRMFSASFAQSCCARSLG